MDWTHWATATPAGCGLCGSCTAPIYWTPVGWRCLDVIACVMRIGYVAPSSPESESAAVAMKTRVGAHGH